jgi:acyl-CoA thioesterase-1
MASAPIPRLNRRAWLSAAAAALAAPALARAPRSAPIVTILGDSITAGYGLAAAEALPARLQAALGRLGVGAQVIGAGVSGDTTADGLARLDFSVRPGARLCVVALGGNDLLNGLEPAVTRRNLDAIVRRLKARGIGVIIAGLAAPLVIGPAYAREFTALFAQVARADHVGFYPDLLAGVHGRRDLLQADGIHPNAAGADLIARGLAPMVARALAGAPR